MIEIPADPRRHGLSVLIADDHGLFRDGLRTLLQSMPEAELIGEATDGEEAVEAAALLQPDVVVMDIRMPTLDGIEATRRIVRECPNAQVLMVTMLEDDGSVLCRDAGGARGQLLKGADHAEIVRAIRAVGSGEAIFSPVIAARMAGYFARLQPAVSDLFPELSTRARDRAAAERGQRTPRRSPG